MYDVKPITSKIANDCGPVCLKMLCDYYEIDVPLETLIEECDCRMSGTSGKKLAEVGRAHGLDIKIYNWTGGEVDELVRQDRPCIVWWKYNHYVVCCGLNDEGRVVICNPSRGRYSMTEGTFKSFYSGASFWNGEPHSI